jgi:hypothetical protein
MPELHSTMEKITALSLSLEQVGQTLSEIGDRMYTLKNELQLWEYTQAESIRTKESAGQLTLSNGSKIKLTDSVRMSLTRYGKRELFAEYEALKRKKEVLEYVVKARVGAMSGQQSILAILKKELEVLGGE